MICDFCNLERGSCRNYFKGVDWWAMTLLQKTFLNLFHCCHITNSGNDFSLIEKEAVHQDSGVVDPNKIRVNQV
jgi:hypothetical protein